MAQSVVINEIVSSNSTGYQDEDGTYQDWIELYNNDNVSVSLLNYGLSDDPSLPFKWIFPDVNLAPGAHLIIWCSDKNRTNPNEPLHTNFKISADGEILTLTNPSSEIADQIPAVSIVSNQSYGRSPSGSATFAHFANPSPAALNEVVTNDIVSPPAFSVISGRFTNPFELVLSHSDPEVTILYTLDGSEPTLENLNEKTYSYKNVYRENPGDPDGELLSGSLISYEYNQPITIADRSSQPNDISTISSTYNSFPYYLPQQPVLKSTVVRAKSVKNGVESPIITHNYFVGETAAIFTLPVVSLAVNENDFFNYEDGIYVAGSRFDQWRDANPNENPLLIADANYKQSGSDWQIKAHFSYFTPTGENPMNQDIDLRINGNFTRNFPGKSLRLYARGAYGNSHFSYPIFGEDYNHSNFERLVMRNAGNDWFQAYLRDAFIQRTVQHLNFAYQPYQPSVVFLNGEYWGMLNIRERFDAPYFTRIYGISSSDLDFLEFDGSLIQEGENSHYLDMITFLNNNSLSDSENFNYVNTLMDVENYTDYYIANVYANNSDWPHNNTEFWRKRTTFDSSAPKGQDGRWRWVLKDTDMGFGYNGATEYQYNTLEFATSTGGDIFTNPEWSTLIIRKLLENPDYKNTFIVRFADLINTTYLPERVLGLLDEMTNNIAAEIPRHGSRWANFTQSTWESNIEVIREFTRERPDFQRQHIQNKFGLSNTLNATLDVDNPAHGYLHINTITLRSETPGVSVQPYPWNGVYFAGIPVTVKAFAYPGYVFSHWSGAVDSTSEEITFTPNTDFSLLAHYTVDEENDMPISFFMADTSVPNDTPLQTLEATFDASENTELEFISAHEGYPFNPEHELWRKGSLERVNSPTAINYIEEANDNIPFEESNMRGLQVRQPFFAGAQEAAFIFHKNTTNFKDIKLQFAAKDDGAAFAIGVQYSIDNGTTWTQNGLSSTELPLSNEYQAYSVDFSEIEAVNDNPDFKVRLNFLSEDAIVDNGRRVIFNNIGFMGKIVLGAPSVTSPKLVFYPNPVQNNLMVLDAPSDLNVTIYTLDGRQIHKGKIQNRQVDMSNYSSGVYLVEFQNDNFHQINKIIKK